MWMKNITLGTVVAVCVGAAVLINQVVADETSPESEYVTTRDRITALSAIAALSTGEKLGRLQELEAMASTIELRWRDADVAIYGRLMLYLAGRIDGLDVPIANRNFISQSIALRALERADTMPLDVQCDLLGAIRKNVDQDGKPLKGEDWAQLRRKQVILQLQGWKRIEGAIDKNWDPEDRAVRNVSPPPATGLPAGVAPDAIQDQQLRQEYIADIELNRQKASRYKEQALARRLLKHWVPGAKRFIIMSYMEAPDKTEELRALLGQYVSDAASREQVLDAVKNKEMPEDLVLKNTTQPAQ